ncbi:MAG: type II toxin-antitoxin system mRNA interferase toxin, RelE/StbE family [Candidatus Pacebacteria bacterium]|jgi:addiction module RelE/StbE family toxin|nr:type II toxin-antitoxin system mRNA interferase toxin, RelE/StbE family [Candidatus Paceibacterota bacterium]
MKIIYSPRFERAYKKLSDDVKDDAELAEGIFRKNPLDARLRTHKLSGRLSDYWSFSVDFEYRIIFYYGKSKEDIFLT